MIGRRKGERPYVHAEFQWSESCAVARAIRTGDRWLYAWIMQQCVGMDKLASQSGIAHDRLDQLWKSGSPTNEELAALAIVFRADAASLHASIAYERSLGGNGNVSGL